MAECFTKLGIDLLFAGGPAEQWFEGEKERLVFPCG